MSGTGKPKLALDDASSIAAFLSKIGITGTPSARPEDVAKNIRYLNSTDGKATDVEANRTLANTSAVQITDVSNLANPVSNPPQDVPAEGLAEPRSENASAEHLMSSKPVDGSLQQIFQASAQGSPHTAGILAPPPTPESISSAAVGKMIYDELDRIPGDRFMSLGDSKFAPTNHSRLRNTRLASNGQFFSAVPRSTKPRNDPSFTRMSFKAADAPSASSADQKENARPGALKDGWSQTNPANDPPMLFTPDTPDSPPAAPQLKSIRLEEVKTVELPTLNTLDAPAGPLTPSSMAFTAASPPKLKAAAGITPATGPAKIVGENLEGALYFKAWPTQPKSAERASRSAAKHRRVLLTGLPRTSTATFVASLVYGGALESIRTAEGTAAFVTFLRADDAAIYYDATANGLLFKKEGVEHVIMTDLCKDVDPISGVLREWIEKEFTRCVRAVGVDEDWSLQALYETAGKKGRKVEKVVDGTNTNGMRSVMFRFCEIADAVKFKQTLSRAEDWEECNIHFAPDPCADATGIHFE
ncbi:MAG: hypothetical protein LQ341_000137 [Variospora aurantia]|nr:MAG: hypothetical protein LQ341_000137 [Variospora aurantia]